jgi:hypothetical protein
MLARAVALIFIMYMPGSNTGADTDRHKLVGFEVHTDVNMKTVFFCNVTPCSLVHCHLSQDSNLHIKTKVLAVFLSSSKWTLRYYLAIHMVAASQVPTKLSEK